MAKLYGVMQMTSGNNYTSAVSSTVSTFACAARRVNDTKDCQ